MSRVAFTSEDVRAQALAEGVVKGVVKGKAEGIELGIEQGRSQIALATLNEGEPEARICRITGLSRKELALLKRSLPK